MTAGLAANQIAAAVRRNSPSSATPDRAAGRSLRVYLESPNGPALDPLRIDVAIDVAGRHETFTAPGTDPLPLTYTWDGKDAYGREVVGRVPARVHVGYAYNGVYERISRFGYKGNGNTITGSITRREVTIWETLETSLEAWDARGVGLGGWTIDRHHTYDPVGRVLHLGDGGIRDAQALGSVIRTVATSPSVRYLTAGPDGAVYFSSTSQVWELAPDGTVTLVAGTNLNYGGDGGPATSASLRYPAGLAVGADGGLYIADSENHRIRRVDLATGIITTAVGPPCTPGGTCPSGFGGDGKSATDLDVRLNAPVDVDVGPDGSLYIAERGRVRRVSPAPEWVITTVAGNGNLFNVSSDGVVAAGSPIGSVDSVAVGKDGSVYFPTVAANDHRIRRIGSSGKLTTVAGSPGPPDSSGDGGPATAARLNQPQGISIGADGSLYIAEAAGNRVRRVGPSGIITKVAGEGTAGFSGDGGPAGLTKLREPGGAAVGPEGSIYIADKFNSRIRRVAGLLPALADSDYSIPSEDGREVYELDPKGRHVRTRDALTGATTYAFGYADGRLATITDRSGQVTTIERDALGAPTAIRAPGGERTTLGVTNSYLETIANPASETFAATYIGAGLLRTLTDPRGTGHSYTFSYDALGRLVRDDDPEGGYKTLALTQSGPTATVVHANQVDLTTALGRAYRYLVERLTDGSRRRVDTGPDLLATQVVRDLSGTRTISASDGTISTAKLGPDQNRFGIQAPVLSEVKVTTPAMRAANPPREAVFNQTRTATLADPGDLLSLTGQTALVETLTVNTTRTFIRTYDATTRTITEESALQPTRRRRTVTLDSAGRVWKTQVDDLEEVVYDYDGQGRLWRIHQGTGLEERRYELGYDGSALTRVTSITNPLDQVVGLAHDAADRVTAQTEPDTSQVLFAYDAAGNLSSLTPPGKPAHGFAYTKVNLERTYTPPQPSPPIATPATGYAYNTDRQLELVTQPQGTTIDYAYEPTTGRLATITLPGGQGQLSYTYDATSGYVSSIVGPSAGETVAYAYDGFLPTAVTWSGAVAGSVGWTYDDAFRLSAEAVNGTDQVSFTYDADDLLTGLAGPGAGPALTITREVQEGGLVAGTSIGGVTETRSHNSFGELASVDVAFGAATLYSVTYDTRDKLGRITEKSEAIARPGGGTDTYLWTYTYDAGGRLDTVSVTGSTSRVADYAYDANGNRTAAPNLTGTATYDDQDRLLSYPTAAGTTSFTYTDDGALRTKTTPGGTTTYEYDALGGLRKVTPPPPAAEIEYLVDGQGRRIGRKVGGVLESAYLYQDQLRIAAELDAAGAVVSRFVYGTQVNVPEYMVKGGQPYRLVTDHLGSVRLLVNVDTGAIAQRIDYDEYGIVTQDTNPGFQPFGFAGGIHDTATGLVRFGARDYDALLGRWVARDPVRFLAGTANLFTYVNGSPQHLSDPYGLFAIPAALLACLETPVCANAVMAATAATAYVAGQMLARPRDTPPALPPPSPPNPLAPSRPAPGEGWRQQCINLYVACRQGRWTGPCDDCLNKCTAQHEWDFEMCSPAPRQCR